MGITLSIPLPSELCVGCWKSGAKQAIYVCQLKDNLEALQTAVEALSNLKKDVTRRVIIEEEDPRMKCLDQVQGWLSSSEETIREVRAVIGKRPHETATLCLGGCCSKNCMSSYLFGKKVAKNLEYVKGLKLEGEALKQMNHLVDKIPYKPVVEKPIKKTIGLDKKLDEVWSYLVEDQVGIIGLSGMRGVGKSTLLTKVNNKFLTTKNEFDIVLWVTVSIDASIEKVQDDIGKRLGTTSMEWKSKDLKEKAEEIFSFLRKKKFVLLLDDIWERVNLDEVGIPYPTMQPGSKVVFTTQFDQVCREMEVEKMIKLEPLEWQDAWELFKEMVGEETLLAEAEILPVAQSIARDCDGLPLALNTIARTMKGKRSVPEWQYTLHVFRNFAMRIEGVQKVFRVLKCSYDKLPNKELKSCFLYCSLFPKDFKILKERLIELWVCEDFWDDQDDGCYAHYRGHNMIGTLVSLNLLEDMGKYVKMNHLIREMALWIANDSTHNYLVQAGIGLKEAPEIGRWRGVTRISLMDNDITSITYTPTSHNLSTLLLHDIPLMEISKNFFMFMGSLTVLDLSFTYIKELPAGISSLASLQYLNLEMTQIVELPSELKKLRKLRCLILDFMIDLCRIPRRLISSLSSLQVLRMYTCGSLKNLISDDNILVERDKLLEELDCLKHLNVLTIELRGAFDVWSFVDTIQRLPQVTQGISFSSFHGLSSFDLSVFGKFKRLQHLSFTMNDDLKELDLSWGSQGASASLGGSMTTLLNDSPFNNLERVELRACSELKDLTWLIIVSPKLASLLISDCEKMEEIISIRKLRKVFVQGIDNANMLTKLEFLSLDNLPQLKRIYREALPFLSLSTIEVAECPKLKTLPLNVNSARGREVVIRGEEEWWNNVKWKDSATKATFESSFVPEL